MNLKVWKYCISHFLPDCLLHAWRPFTMIGAQCPTVASQDAESKLCTSVWRMPAYGCIPFHSACFLFRPVPFFVFCVCVLSVSVSVSRPVLSQHAESKLCASFSRMPAYRCIPAHSACFLFRLVPSCPVVCLLVCGCLSVWPVLSCPFLSCPVLCVFLHACAAPGTVLSSGLCEVL